MIDGQNEIVPVALPAPGWYPDPGNPAMTRWWSGNGWTDYVAPLEERPAPAMAELEAGSSPAPASAPAPEASDAIAEQGSGPRASSPDGAPIDVEPAPPALGTPVVVAEPAPFAPDLTVTPSEATAEQQAWHSRSNRKADPRRGEVASPGTARASTRRPASDYQPNWIAGLAFVLAIISIPVIAVRVLMDLHPLTQSIAAGAPITIALLAFVTSVRRGGRGILLSIVAVLLSAATLAAGLLLPRDVVQSATDLVLGYLNLG